MRIYYPYYYNYRRGKNAFLVIAFIILFLLLFDSPLHGFIKECMCWKSLIKPFKAFEGFFRL